MKISWVGIGTFLALATALNTTVMTTTAGPGFAKTVTSFQEWVTKKGGTEAPFKNEFWNHKEAGIYVDLYTGQPLFSSLDKYDSGTGWPSFTKPIEPDPIEFKLDRDLGTERNEVRSKSSDSHLGHVFDDGPKEKGGKRYCMNSAALRFVPLDQMRNSDYDRFLFDFKKQKNWEVATFAAGCFWGTEKIFLEQNQHLGKIGIIATQTGYSGGKTEAPTYESVSKGDTGHAETVQILFDPKIVTYEQLVTLFFKMHDPTTLNRQEGDVGTQYRSVIFYETPEQKKTAEAVIQRVNQSKAWKKPVVTELAAFGRFWRAEGKHQKYLVRNPKGYSCHYVRPGLKF